VRLYLTSSGVDLNSNGVFAEAVLFGETATGTDKLRPEKGLDHPTNSGQMGRTADRIGRTIPEKLVISIDGKQAVSARCQISGKFGTRFTESITREAPEHLVPEVLQKS